MTKITVIKIAGRRNAKESVRSFPASVLPLVQIYLPYVYLRNKQGEADDASPCFSYPHIMRSVKILFIRKQTFCQRYRLQLPVHLRLSLMPEENYGLYP